MQSFEDRPPEHVFDPHAVRHYDSWFRGETERFFHVVILRDPYNCFASRFQHEINGNFHHGDIRALASRSQRRYLAELYKIYARAFLAFRGDYEVAISYNRWCRDRPLP